VRLLTLVFHLMSKVNVVVICYLCSGGLSGGEQESIAFVPVFCDLDLVCMPCDAQNIIRGVKYRKAELAKVVY